MCGRFTLAKKKIDIINEYQQKFNWKIIDLSTKNYAPNYNITPSQEVSVIYCDDLKVYFDYHQWGLIPRWAKDKKIGSKLINARVETVAEKPSFKDAFLFNRCLIIADGYFEWGTAGKEKIPYYFFLDEGKSFAFAGLRAVWQDTGETIFSCSIITTEAKGKFKEIHPRMPVILKPEYEKDWINLELKDNDKLFEILMDNYNAKLNCCQVSKEINNPRNNGPELIKPVYTQMKLFD